MTSRREFLRRLTAVAVTTGSAGAITRWPEPSSSRPFYKVIVDERFPESAQAARRFTDRGAQVHHIRGDITALWFHDLYFHWRSRRTPVAGVTTEASLFCLEVLARDAAMRVLSREELDSGLIAWSIGTNDGVRS